MVSKADGNQGFIYKSQEDLVSALKKSVGNRDISDGLMLFSKEKAEVDVSGSLVIIKQGGNSVVIDLSEINKTYPKRSIFAKKIKDKTIEDLAAKIFSAESESKVLSASSTEEVKGKVRTKVESKDIVCEYSQGRLTDVRKALGIKNTDEDNKGSLACAVICLKAVESFFTEGLPKNKEDIYRSIHEGVSQYMQEGRQGLLEFDDVFSSLNPKLQDKLEVFIPSASDGIDPEIAGLFEAIGSVQAPVSTHLDSLLQCVQNKSLEANNICAVLTTQSPRSTNATVVIMFDENKRPALFNSHGEPYKGQDLGASLLRFEDMDKLSEYIKRTFFKNQDGEFQLKILIKE